MKNNLKIQKEMFEKIYEIQKETLNKLELELMHINTKEEKKNLCETYLKVYTAREVFKKNLEDIQNQMQLMNDEEETE